MIDTLDYIDQYFTGKLSPEERLAFETRCETDTAFAREVSFYIGARGALKDLVAEEKRTEFKALYETVSKNKSSTSSSTLVRLMPYLTALAACFLLFLGWQFFLNKPDTPQQLASSYIEENLSTLSVTMGSEQDSLALGIQAFNEHEFDKAEAIFNQLKNRAEVRFESLKYLGLLYLNKNDYSKAIEEFNALSKQTGLYANPALFYKAITLMKRSGEGDLAQAEALLNKVVAENQAGHKEASKWLDGGKLKSQN